MSRYVLLLHGDEDDYKPEDFDAALAAHQRFMEAVPENGGQLLSGEALQSQSTARHVRTSDGLVTDGPFAELKEALGGYYVIEADSMDHAVELAKLCPEPIIEVRPIMEMP